MYNHYLRCWIMIYGSKADHAILMRGAPHPVGPWSEPEVVHSEPGAYGPFMYPWLMEENEKSVYLTLSRWGPYQVSLMKATF